MDQATNVLIAEVKVFHQYLSGDVYGYVVSDDEGNEVGSCWGYYGMDYCIEAAKECVPDKSAIGTYSI